MVQEAAVQLDLGDQLSEEESLAALCILTTGLKYIWEARLDKKVVHKYKMRAEIEAKVSILRKTRHSASSTQVDNLIEMLN